MVKNNILLLIPVAILIILGLITYCTLINPEGQWSQQLLWLVPILFLPVIIGLYVTTTRHAKALTASSKSREEYLNEIKSMVGGSLNAVREIRGERCYQLDFSFKKRHYEYLDLLKLYYDSDTNRSHVVQDCLILRTSVSDNLSILFQKELGDTIVGQTAEKVMDTFQTQGCSRINPEDLYNLYPEFRVFSNNKERAIPFLTGSRVVEVIRSMIVKQDLMATFLPLQIKEGWLELNFYYYVNIKNETQIFPQYLDKLDTLANQLS